jgi:hypothetical protein
MLDEAEKVPRTHSAENTRNISLKEKIHFLAISHNRISQALNMFPRMNTRRASANRAKHNFYVGLLTHGESRKIRRIQPNTAESATLADPAPDHRRASVAVWDYLLQ